MKSGKFILALDQGTTSSRALVIDHAGRVVAVSQREYRQIYPKPGWVEHDPLEIWSSQAATEAEALGKADLRPHDIAAIGITNQRETTVVWDRHTGKPVCNAIVWQDRRTADYCAKLKAEGLEPMFSEKTGLRIDPYFSGTKLRWILENMDGVARPRGIRRSAFRHGGQLAGLETHRRQGPRRRTPPTPRARCFSISTKTRGTRKSSTSSTSRARCCRRCATAAGSSDIRSTDVPIAGIAGDQHAALFGQACFEPGMAKNTYGTGCFLLMTHRRKGHHLAKQPAHDHRLADRRENRIRARRIGLHGRRGRPVAARRIATRPLRR